MQQAEFEHHNVMLLLMWFTDPQFYVQKLAVKIELKHSSSLFYTVIKKLKHRKFKYCSAPLSSVSEFVQIIYN